MAQKEKNIYFASDFHLGLDNKLTSMEREKKIVEWLRSIEASCSQLFLLGDLFDYWFEYKESVPKGYVRFLGQLANMADSGIQIHLFIGNHDMWQKDYLKDEIGLNLYYEPRVFTFGDKTFFLGHGDGLGPGDLKYKFIKKFIRNPFLQWCYSLIHPTWGLKLMRFFSQRNDRYNHEIKDIQKEWLMQFAEDTLLTQDVDYFIFGHRHVAIDYTLSNSKSKYVNLGDWLDFCTYAVFDGHELVLKQYDESSNTKIFRA
jgi:UDP-2,3-diacylglucosamine hydrolase